MTSSTAMAAVSPSVSRATNRRVPAMVAVLVLLVAATVLVNLVLPGWAYPLCGLVVAAALLGVARWSGLRAYSIGLDLRRLRRPGSDRAGVRGGCGGAWVAWPVW
jgi:hypothetical protein